MAEGEVLPCIFAENIKLVWVGEMGLVTVTRGQQWQHHFAFGYGHAMQLDIAAGNAKDGVERWTVTQ